MNNPLAVLRIMMLSYTYELLAVRVDVTGMHIIHTFYIHTSTAIHSEPGSH